jgi:hypothetical protein
VDKQRFLHHGERFVLPQSVSVSPCVGGLRRVSCSKEPWDEALPKHQLWARSHIQARASTVWAEPRSAVNRDVIRLQIGTFTSWVFRCTIQMGPVPFLKSLHDTTQTLMLKLQKFKQTYSTCKPTALPVWSSLSPVSYSSVLLSSTWSERQLFLTSSTSTHVFNA